jgi:hypothetical protein
MVPLPSSIDGCELNAAFTCHRSWDSTGARQSTARRAAGPGTSGRRHPRDVLVLGVCTIVLGTALLVMAGWLLHAGATSEDELAGVATVLGVVVGAPATLALLLAVPALCLRRISAPAARVLVWVGLLVAATPLLLWIVGGLAT